MDLITFYICKSCTHFSMNIQYCFNFYHNYIVSLYINSEINAIKYWLLLLSCDTHVHASSATISANYVGASLQIYTKWVDISIYQTFRVQTSSTSLHYRWAVVHTLYLAFTPMPATRAIVNKSASWSHASTTSLRPLYSHEFHLNLIRSTNAIQLLCLASTLMQQN
jgi:hypothetical protein